MQECVYNALFGALTQERRLDVIANNLANVNTTGFKRDGLNFRDVFVRMGQETLEPFTPINAKPMFPKPDTFAQVRIGMELTDFADGGIQHTGNPLDFALQGDGFFKVQGPDGEYYTRNGSFKVSQDGLLITGAGHQVVSTAGGAIEVPQNASITANDRGEIFADGEFVNALQVVAVEELWTLEKYGENMFRARPGNQVNEVEPGNFSVAQGYLENSNVNVVEEMVRMIETQRMYESYSKVVQSATDTEHKLVTEVGRAV